MLMLCLEGQGNKTTCKATECQGEQPSPLPSLLSRMTGPILQAKEGDGKPDAKTLRRYSRATHQLFQLWDQLVIIDGILRTSEV